MDRQATTRNAGHQRLSETVLEYFNRQLGQSGALAGGHLRHYAIQTGRELVDRIESVSGVRG